VIDEVDLALPLGTEACWRYTVRRRDKCVAFWFAKARARLSLLPNSKFPLTPFSRLSVSNSEPTTTGDESPLRGPEIVRSAPCAAKG